MLIYAISLRYDMKLSYEVQLTHEIDLRYEVDRETKNPRIKLAVRLEDQISSDPSGVDQNLSWPLYSICLDVF